MIHFSYRNRSDEARDRRPKVRSAVVAVASGLLLSPAPILTSGPAAAAPSCPCTLFPASAVPVNLDANDPNPAELGVQFESSVPGQIVGIRFYKGAENTGVHVGSLWTSGGSLLAQSTFTDESDSGWQQVDFATPVAVAADTLYVAGYHTDTGFYSYDPGYFTNNTVSSPPLSAPSDASGTPNGVFAYSPVPVFPGNTFNGNNYWVDVVFEPAAGPLAITTTSLPAATLGGPYSAAVTAAGGTTPYQFTVTSGQLPLGLTLDPASGVISGTPVVPGSASFTVQVSDSESPPQTATVNLSITTGGCTTVITGNHSGGLTASSGVTCVTNATVGGSLTIKPGAVVAVTGSKFSGPLNSTSAAGLSVCGSTITGPVTVTSSTGPIVFGAAGASPSCAADNITGQVQVSNGTGGVDLFGNQISGSITVTGDTGSAGLGIIVQGNNASGSLTCSSDSPAPIDNNQPNKVHSASGQCATLG